MSTPQDPNVKEQPAVAATGAGREAILTTNGLTASSSPSTRASFGV